MTLPATMRAAFIEATGGPELIRVGELATPSPGPTDVLLRMEATTVNPVDTFVRSGAYATPTPFPFILGRDVVGVVVALGRGVTEFAMGDRVWSNSLGHAGRQGTFSEFVLAPAERAYHLPGGVDPMAAIAVLHNTGTAHLGLFREAQVRLGETVVVEGGAGGVGSAVVQLAKAAGARVIATASAQDHAWCVASGADAVVDYRAPDALVQVEAAAPDGVDVWWDTSGRNDLEACLPLLALGARVVVMSGLASAVTLPVGRLYTRDVSVRGFAISNASISDLAAAARVINAELTMGTLRARYLTTMGLADAARAHAAIDQRAITGRLVVVP